MIKVGFVRAVVTCSIITTIVAALAYWDGWQERGAHCPQSLSELAYGKEQAEAQPHTAWPYSWANEYVFTAGGKMQTPPLCSDGSKPEWWPASTRGRWFCGNDVMIIIKRQSQQWMEWATE